MLKTKWLTTHALTLVAACLVQASLPLSLQAEVKPADIFQSHMVLQQGMEVPIWGTADAGEEVTVSFAGQTATTKAGDIGKWMVRLGALKATANQTGQTLTIAGSNKIELLDVLIGEVWLCSGQSNMSWPVYRSDNADAEIAAANHPQIRLLQLETTTDSRVPADTIGGTWQVCSPESIPKFSAVAYFYGRELHQKLGVPIGLINNGRSATAARTWTSGDALHKTMPEYDEVYRDLVFPGKLYEEKLPAYLAYAETYKTIYRQLRQMEPDIDAASPYAAIDFVDEEWEKTQLPSTWRAGNVGQFEGMIWYRRVVDVPADWAGQDLLLEPGEIYSSDLTWFNGELVGQTGMMVRGDFGRPAPSSAALPRSYRVPGNLVKAGKNTLAIRVVNTQREGGIVATQGRTMKLSLASDGKQSVSLQGEWLFHKSLVLPERVDNPAQPNRPGVLFNGLIHPLIPTAIRGVIWYQGEADTHPSRRYHILLPTLINDWRSRWGQGDFPFLVVQLPNYGSSSPVPKAGSWHYMRLVQANIANTMNNVELAVTIDIGDPQDIHPTNKKDFSVRLSLVALAKTYGQKIAYSGPVYQSHEVKGNQVIVKFDHLEGGLLVKGGKLEGFALAGADGKYVWADAKVQGDSVVVSSDEITSPVHVSYAWDANPRATLFNKAGLPGAPFKTDGP